MLFKGSILYRTREKWEARAWLPLHFMVFILILFTFTTHKDGCQDTKISFVGFDKVQAIRLFFRIQVKVIPWGGKKLGLLFDHSTLLQNGFRRIALCARCRSSCVAFGEIDGTTSCMDLIHMLYIAPDRAL